MLRTPAHHGWSHNTSRLRRAYKKEKLLVTRNFSFSHTVFKRLLVQTRKNKGLFGKRLKVISWKTSVYEQCFFQNNGSKTIEGILQWKITWIGTCLEKWPSWRQRRFLNHRGGPTLQNYVLHHAKLQYVTNVCTNFWKNCSKTWRIFLLQIIMY